MQEGSQLISEEQATNKSVCHPKLKEFIDLINYIPSDYDFPTYKEIERFEGAFWDSLQSAKSLDNAKYLRGATYWMRDLPQEISDFVFQTMDYFEVSERINLLYLLNTSLRLLGEFNSGLRVKTAYYEPAAFNIRLNIQKDENGYLKPCGNEFIKLIEENNIEADRIRVCKMCEKVFWASRNDMKTCNTKCANSLRQKQWRERNSDTYKENRRKKYSESKGDISEEVEK